MFVSEGKRNPLACTAYSMGTARAPKGSCEYRIRGTTMNCCKNNLFDGDALLWILIIVAVIILLFGLN